MNKALMISIRPEHAVNILNGKKTLELRTWIPKDYVGWVYVYVTKGVGKTKYHHLYNLTEYTNGKTFFSITQHNKHSLVPEGYLNSKVVFRFWFDEYIAYKYYEDDNSYFAKRPQDFGYTADEVLKRLCLSRDEFKTYGKGKDLYAWHIKKLEIFEEPKNLRDFALVSNYKHVVEKMTPYEKNMLIFGNPLTKPPQRSVWVYGN